jgi:hypothetical protein
MHFNITKLFNKYSASDIKEYITFLEDRAAVDEYINMLKGLLHYKEDLKIGSRKNSKQLEINTENPKIRRIIISLSNSRNVTTHDVASFITMFTQHISVENKSQALKEFMYFLEPQSDTFLDEILDEINQVKQNNKSIKQTTNSENDLSKWTDIIMKKRD